MSDFPAAIGVDEKRHVVYVSLIRNYKMAGAEVELATLDDGTLRPGNAVNLGRVSWWQKMVIDSAGNIVHMASNDMDSGIIDNRMKPRFTIPGTGCAITSGNDGFTYVVGCDGRVTAYDPKTYQKRYSTKLATGSVMNSNQQSLAVVDSKGRVYLANNRTHTLGIYPPRSAKPSTSRSDGDVADMTIDNEDNVYAIEWPLNPGEDAYSVAVFRSGTLTPVRRYRFSRYNVPFAVTVVE